MKKIPFFTLILLLSFNAFSQSVHQRIQVSDDIELIRLSDNAYIHVSVSEIPGYGKVSSNGLIFIDEGNAFLFDTPVNDSLTRVLVTWLNKKMGVKITGFVPNHWHSDCIGGLGYLQSQGIKSYANQITIDLARMNHLPVPDSGFRDSLNLSLGDRQISCYYFGAAHSKDNIVVWIPSEQILFAGCMVKSMESDNPGNMAEADLEAYPQTLDKISARFPMAKYVIPGHGQFGGMELIRHTKELITHAK